MIRMIRATMLMAAVATFAGAQSGQAPPAKPAKPAPQARPVLPARPLDAVLLDVDHAAIARDMALKALDNVHLEDLHLSQTLENMHLDESLANMRVSLDNFRVDGDLLGHGFGYGVGIGSAPRFQNDPADSLYRRALDLLNRQDYRAAAQRFKDLQQKFPSTQYLALAMYYQAFSLYRAGTDAELKDALSVLDDLQRKSPNARLPRGGNVPDIATLQTQIRKIQAARGDASAKQAVAQAAASGTQPCDRDEQLVQAEALSGLMRMDPDAATAHLDKILARRDECSTELRRSALQILVRRGDDKSVATLLATAKSDPSPRIRSDALEDIARFPSADVLSTLESVARNDQNDQIRRAAARNLVGYPNPAARQIVRSLVEDEKIPDGVRSEMLDRFNEDRGTPEDATWLRAAYPNVKSPEVKRGIIGAVARIGGADSQKWLMDLSSNEQESASTRADAFRRVSSQMTAQDLIRAYDNAGSRPMREQIVSGLNRRKEPEALDKLIDIVKKGSDPEVRSLVIRLLAERKDPKVTQLLLELIDK